MKFESIDQIMDCRKSQSKKLTRTSSSLLRSSPAVRSSIHSLSSVSEFVSGCETQDLEEQKPHSRPVHLPVRFGRSRVAPLVAVFLFSLYTLYAFFYEVVSYLLLASILVAVVMFLFSRNRDLVKRNFNLFKQLWDEHVRDLGLSCFSSETHSETVRWFIGETESVGLQRKKQCRKGRSPNLKREGVEFYSNGDVYEGEIHMGRCNGSGVYTYFSNGRFEGDWIDGRYDGYGIESWARGSRYIGQYRQGLRHGYGVYKFYTGDSYAGEWCNGQSQGVGAQTCADGSCYVGEFKCGVKHGLGCYNFRNGDRYGGERRCGEWDDGNT